MIIRIVFKGKEEEVIKSLLNTHSIERPNDLIRFLVLENYKKSQSEQIRYGSGNATPKTTKAEARQNKINELGELDAYGLQQYLREIGFFGEDKELGGGRWKGERVLPYENSLTTFIVHYHEDDPTNYTYKASIFTFDQLMRELEKQGKLLA